MLRKHLLLSAISIMLIACQSTPPESEEIMLTIPEGFELEELFRPSDHKLGTWVSLAEGHNNQMFACDQWGKIYTFQKPAIGNTLEPTDIDSLDLDIGFAHGMIWAYNSLYVAVNREWKDTIETGSGIYKLDDSDADGVLDRKTMLMKLDGEGEHGPHSFVLHPADSSLYFIAGNHTKIPAAITLNSLVPTHWAEDNLLSPYPDARGHAADIEAPGGWIARTLNEGEDWQLVSVGYRNAFDMAFNDDNELFTFDADMEWDFGMPWYRPIRICHVTSGSEFGWRTGTGKWPTYYPDALPAVIDLGQGSPTAVLFGGALNFPEKYRNGLFVADWSFGTLYYIDLSPQGATYTATKEEFLYGVPLPLTDVIADNSGDMYFATGGRNLASQLYRLRYVGDDIVTNKEVATNTSENALLRKELEQMHTNNAKVPISKAWQHLDHKDRFVQYAARLALEHQDLNSWNALYDRENNPSKIIQSTIAAARIPNSKSGDALLNKLLAIDFNGLSADKKLSYARAIELILNRKTIDDDNTRQSLVDKLNSYFPLDDLALNREFAEILIFLQSEAATNTCLNLMLKYHEEGLVQKTTMISEEVSNRSDQYGEQVKAVVENMPPAESIFYAVLLSHAQVGWTEEAYNKYYNWFYDVLKTEGGLSFKAFMDDIRSAALKNVPEDKRTHYEELSGVFNPAALLADLPEPEGPGMEYSSASISKLLRSSLANYKGDFNHGKQMFDAALCSSCHRMKGEGGINGPDLTQIHTRFNRWDLISAVLSPNDEISDQYAFTLFDMKDGTKRAGKIYTETDESVTIMPNPYTSGVKVDLLKTDIEDRGLSPVSPMPPGLVNRLNEEEITALFAYLLSGGNKRHRLYTGKK